MFQHKPTVHTNCTTIACPICDGGLFVCEKCCLMEGALTTDCPEVKVGYDMGDFVYNGFIDFVEGRWIEGNGDMPFRSSMISVEGRKL